MCGLLPVVSGVPQGSILDLYFSLYVYINHLPLSFISSHIIFACDTKSKMRVSSIKDCIALLDDLDSMASWSQTWKLLFKDSKFAVVTMCSSEPKSVHIRSMEVL